MLGTRIGLITGISGQDGSYMTELLLSKGYEVWGLIRKSTTPIRENKNIGHLVDNERLTLKYGDMCDGGCIASVLAKIKNKYVDLERLEIYNLAALSHVGVSFELPEYTSDVNGLGVLRVLEAVRSSGYQDKIRFYQASTSELYGKVIEIPQSESTPFYPRSPYAVAKLYGYWISKNYREAYGLYVCNGVLFNHESPRRDEIFVTRKITKGLMDILTGRQKSLVLGNLDAKRDWGHAKDYVRGMWLMMQQETADDFVLCTNENHSVKEFVEKAFSLGGFTIKWVGEGLEEKGYDETDVELTNPLIVVNKDFYRPSEVDFLIGDCTKAKTVLGWDREYTFDDLVQEMVDADCQIK